MKKILAFLLSVAVCLSLLTACGASAGQSSDPGAQASETQTPESEAPESETPETEAPESAAPNRTIEEDYEFEGPGIVTLKDYPESYNYDAAQMGTVETVTYSNGVEEKYLNIYLPYGYETGKDSYNVLYIMHGGGGRPETFLQTDRTNAFQRILDNMIENGDIDPIIVVAPSWNSAVSDADSSSPSSYGPLTEDFARDELAQYVIPLVDENYRTNADRDGRAFGGFSMGGVTTWYTFLYDLADIRYFIPMSGDCWVLGEYTSMEQTVKAVELLAESVGEQGYTGDDFTIYCYTGTQDIAIPNLAPQIYAMQDNEMFDFGNNTFFGAYPDARHTDAWVKTYLYNTLPLLWKD